MSDSEPNNIGRLARKPATGLFKLHSIEPVEHFPVKKFLTERLILQLVLDFERSTCGHLVEVYRQGCQTCILVVEKIFLEEKHTSSKKNNSYMFWDSERKFFAGIAVSVSKFFVKKELYMSRGFS